MTTDRDVVVAFATALDKEDYAVAASLLADGCTYEAPEGTLVGRAAIIQSYSKNGEAATQRFDSVQYRHEVSARADGTFCVTFIDRIQSCGCSHVYRCQQLVSCQDGLIQRITHQEIPGAREALDQFVHRLKLK